MTARAFDGVVSEREEKGCSPSIEGCEEASFFIMKNNKSFSLVDLIVVISIMAILAAIAIPTFAHFITKAHEASDAELLHNINYIFNTACIENGVDVKDVTAAEWDKTNKCVINVKVNGTDNDDIEASFVTHFDLTEEAFKLIENIVFDPEKHEFIDVKDFSSIYTDIFNSIENIDDPIALVNGSTFGKIGAKDLLIKVDDVTGLAEALFNSDGNSAQKLKEALSSDIENIAKAMGMTKEQFEAHVAAQENPDAYYNILANYAVLHVANTTANQSADDLLADLKSACQHLISVT